MANHLGPHTIVLADKAYDADRSRTLINGQGATPNIPANPIVSGSLASASGFIACATSSSADADFRKVVEVLPKEKPGTVEHNFW